jgi:hypothetical protein
MGLLTVACGADRRDGFQENPEAGSETDGGASSESFGDAGTPQADGGPGIVEDPATCAEAAANRSYIGCDYWPTVTPNNVWSVFDFAVVVSNPGAVAADVLVVGPDGFSTSAIVQPNGVAKIYLPWVADLKGPDADALTNWTQKPASLLKRGGAYHLTSNFPVLVYQFNPLEYSPKGGPAGKDWGTCPGGKALAPDVPIIECLSYSNDASLLLPSTAMTGSYRVATVPGYADNGGVWGYISVTATEDGTTVKTKLGACGVEAGSGVGAVAAFGTATYVLNAGDVLQLAGRREGNEAKSDLSGSIVQADKPVQVIGSTPSMAFPKIVSGGHVEETVMPAETLGRRYAVTRPSTNKGAPGDAAIRFIGNVDGTTLKYSSPVTSSGPSGTPIPLPTKLDAGEVVVALFPNADFVVEGDHEFSLSSLHASRLTNDRDEQHDPQLSNIVAIEQYRLKYVFLAPDDYASSYADIVAPDAAKLVLDGANVVQPRTPIANSGYSVLRVELGAGNAGAHTLQSDLPVGLQVIGYGRATSYQYPGGLNLLRVAPPLPPIIN